MDGPPPPQIYGNNDIGLGQPPSTADMFLRILSILLSASELHSHETEVVPSIPGEALLDNESESSAHASDVTKQRYDPNISEDTLRLLLHKYEHILEEEPPRRSSSLSRTTIENHENLAEYSTALLRRPNSTGKSAFKTLEEVQAIYAKLKEPFGMHVSVAELKTQKSESKIGTTHGRSLLLEKLRSATVGGVLDQTHILSSFMNTESRGRSVSFSPTNRHQLEASGKLNGMEVNAHVDTGSSFNAISQALANTLGLKVTPGTDGDLTLPSGKRIYSPGEVYGTFTFSGDGKAYPLTCVVLKKTVHSLVLGSRFLRMTQTMKLYATRLKKTFSKLMSIKLLGGQQDMLSGYLNGKGCSVIPDTGSDIMVMSSAYARKLKLKIDKRKRHKRRVQFLDGSRGATIGVVKDVEWKFRRGDAPIKCDFHVMDNLPVNVIVSNAFLDQFNVFSDYEDLITEQEPEEDEAGIYGISLIERYREEIRSLEDQYIEDMTSANPFTPEMADRERARREEINDRIDRIPIDQQGSYRVNETKRRRQWKELRRKHREDRKALTDGPQKATSMDTGQNPA